MTARGHRRSARERAPKEVAKAKRASTSPKKAPAPRKLTRLTGNPFVDYLENPSPVRAAALTEMADGGEVTRNHVAGAITHEFATIERTMRETPHLFKDLRMGFSLRRDMLQTLLENVETTGSGNAVVTVHMHWPARVGPERGDEVRTAKGDS